MLNTLNKLKNNCIRSKVRCIRSKVRCIRSKMRCFGQNGVQKKGTTKNRTSLLDLVRMVAWIPKSFWIILARWHPPPPEQDYKHIEQKKSANQYIKKPIIWPSPHPHTAPSIKITAHAEKKLLLRPPRLFHPCFLLIWPRVCPRVCPSLCPSVCQYECSSVTLFGFWWPSTFCTLHIRKKQEFLGIIFYGFHICLFVWSFHPFSCFLPVVL